MPIKGLKKTKEIKGKAEKAGNIKVDISDSQFLSPTVQRTLLSLFIHTHSVYRSHPENLVAHALTMLALWVWTSHQDLFTPPQPLSDLQIFTYTPHTILGAPHDNYLDSQPLLSAILVYLSTPR